MKGKTVFLTKMFFMMIAIIVPFLSGAVDKACAGSGSVVIPMTEFSTDGGTWTSPGDFSKHLNGGFLQGGTSDPCLIAPVRIPGNATRVNKLIVYLRDWHIGQYSPYFHFSGITMETGEYEVYYDGSVTRGDETVQAIELPLLKHKLVKGRVYQLGTCLDQGQQFYGAKVIYTAP